MVAELAAYGFDPADGPATGGSAVTSSPATGATARVHGIGLDPAEPPSGDDDGQIHSGSVVVIEASVADAGFGRVRLGTVAGVDRETTELVAYPTAVTPAAIDAAAADEVDWERESERREADDDWSVQ